MIWNSNSIALVAGGLFLGSIPFSYLVVRARTGRDLREVGSGNPGATNALRVAGRAAALTGLVLDTAKGLVPVWLAREAGVSGEVVAALAVACVLGHVLSPFLGFHGGKGVATGFGALAALNPLAGAIGLFVFFATIVLSRVVSLGSILAMGSISVVWFVPGRFGFAGAAGQGDDAGWWAAIVIFALVLVRHLPNLRRLVDGTESRLGEKRA